ncbi:MAG TPA: hypothetical protein VMU80_09455 [Bryobacteraceae bacterium]|nr:hypothetical protein [Bryobacteraceae bacterium]
MAEKPEKKAKKDKEDKAAAVSEPPAVTVPVEKKKPPKPKIPQLAKKNKSRLPRRQKKALQKAADKA